MIKRIKKLLGKYRIDNVLVTPYRSYGTKHHLYVKGRVLDDIPLKIKEDQGLIRTLQNTFRQFDTFEIPDAEMELNIAEDIKLEVKSDEEGYYLFNKTIEQDISQYSNPEGWVTVDLYYKNELDKQTKLVDEYFQGELLIPEDEAEYGVISDIDDTILHTGVTSFLKWRLLKNSLLTNTYNRIPLKGAPEFFQKLHLGKSGKNKNPMFYLSNSPWNMYQYLKLFLDFNKFPKGPILLRKFRTPFDGHIKPEKPHKQHEIINILNTYPQLKFILIGDSGEHDASIYTDMAVQFPDRILAIYLKSVRHKRQMNRIRSIVDEFKSTPVLMADTSADAQEHAKESGFI